MFDIGWSELLVIGVVALVVIGPKDLPKALKLLGFWVRKARSISRDFQSSVEEMIREAELEDVRREMQKATSLDIEGEFKKTIDPKGEIAEHLKPPDLDAPPPSAPAETAGDVPATGPASLPASEETQQPAVPAAPGDAPPPAKPPGAA
jgi:sec-independent protein translocase protein TatB